MTEQHTFHFVPASRYSFDPGHQHLFIWRRRRRSSTNDSIQVDNFSYEIEALILKVSKIKKKKKKRRAKAQCKIKKNKHIVYKISTRTEISRRIQLNASIHLMVTSTVSCRQLNRLCLPKAGEARGVLIGLPSTPGAKSTWQMVERTCLQTASN